MIQILEKIQKHNLVPDHHGRRPSEFLTMAQNRVLTTGGEKEGKMRKYDFVWAKSEMQGFRDQMEGEPSLRMFTNETNLQTVSASTWSYHRRSKAGPFLPFLMVMGAGVASWLREQMFIICDIVWQSPSYRGPQTAWMASSQLIGFVLRQPEIKNIASDENYDAEDIKSALEWAQRMIYIGTLLTNRHAFVEMDLELKKQFLRFQYNGSTCTTALITTKHILTANLGEPAYLFVWCIHVRYWWRL